MSELAARVVSSGGKPVHVPVETQGAQLVELNHADPNDMHPRKPHLRHHDGPLQSDPARQGVHDGTTYAMGRLLLKRRPAGRPAGLQDWQLSALSLGSCYRTAVLTCLHKRHESCHCAHALRHSSPAAVMLSPALHVFLLLSTAEKSIMSVGGWQCVCNLLQGLLVLHMRMKHMPTSQDACCQCTVMGCTIL